MPSISNSEEMLLSLTEVFVKDGVSFLDRYAPEDWRKRVVGNGRDLYIRNYDRCVLARAFRGTKLQNVLRSRYPFWDRLGPSKTMYTHGDVCREFSKIGIHIDSQGLGFLEIHKDNVSYHYLQRAWEEELGIS